MFCTGGAGTICSAQVRALVYLGANACIIGRNVEKTEKAAQDIATVRPGAVVIGFGDVDVRKVESVQKAVDACIAKLGGIDFVMYDRSFSLLTSQLPASALSLLHVTYQRYFDDGLTFFVVIIRAGAAGNFLAPITALSANAFKSVIDIDVLGSYNTLKATLPALLKSAAANVDASEGLHVNPRGTGGRIIFISATLHYAGTPLQTHVNVAKAGVDALSNNVAVEFGPRGITSNIIAPGPIQGTEGMDRLSRKEDAKAGMRGVPLGRCQSLPQISFFLGNCSPAMKLSIDVQIQCVLTLFLPGGRVKEIADATVYIFSDTGNFVTGQTLVGEFGLLPNFIQASSSVLETMVDF